MKTNDLIEALVQDAPRPQLSPARRVLGAAVLGTFVAATLFAISLGVRPDLGSALETWRFLLKPVLSLLCVACAWWACLQLTRPEVRPRDVAVWLLAAPALLVAAVLYELLTIPPAHWAERLVGNYAVTCLLAIPLLSVVPLTALLIALRAGASRAPASAGAVAGLFAGALTATLYATHCPDDSPLFVAVSLVISAGALAGSRVLRW